MPDEDAAVQPQNPALEHLRPLIGNWVVSAMGGAMDQEASGQVSFEWLEGGAFILQRWQPPDPMPNGVAVIGCDDSTGRCAMQYFDSRGVARIYELSLRDGAWQQWRDAPGFSQRFTGTFSDDGNTISGVWELSRDGSTWDKDFELTFRRAT